MSPEARALAQVLLNHHWQVCSENKVLTTTDSALISYGVLCNTAGLSYLTHNVGPFLREIAEWCHNKGWPPINSLAVNHLTRMPGEGYEKAPGCSLLHWPEELEATIRFSGYPDTVE